MVHTLFNDERDFTTWLGEIKKLEPISKIINKKLDVHSIDKNIVGKRPDIKATINSDKRQIVLIENQFKKSDPRHLGEILTYLIKNKAKIGIWIAEGFSKVHLDVVERLNNSNLGFNILTIIAINPEGNKDKENIQFEQVFPLKIGQKIGAINQDDLIIIDEKLLSLIKEYEKNEGRKAIKFNTMEKIYETIGSFQEFISKGGDDNIRTYLRYFKSNRSHPSHVIKFLESMKE